MQSESTNTKVETIGIIGGGKVGLQMFHIFSSSQLIKVSYVVDKDSAAPAIMAARKAHVLTFTSVESALSQPVDFILEVTGSRQVAEMVAQKTSGTSTHLITHEMAFIILKAIGENNRQIAGEIGEIKNEITRSLDGISVLVESMDDIVAQMNILSINARIEAAREGEHGRGFAVVASEIGKAAGNVKTITQQIDQVNTSVAATSTKIDTSLSRLS